MFSGEGAREGWRYGVAILALLLTIGWFANAVFAGNGKHSPGAKSALSKVERRILDDTANSKTTDFIVLMAEQANVSSAYGMTDQDARGWYIYNTLKATADKSQAQLQAMLNKRDVSYQAFWLPNALAVFGGDRALVESIAARADVRKLESNHPFKGIGDGRWTMDDRITNSPSSIAHRPSSVEWGVQRVNAPQVWAMGFTGQGITIGNEDTGMRWTHNALKPEYRGWNGSVADHNYNWWDGVREPVPGHTSNPCGYAIVVPCDDNAHGTHTTGTTVGDDGMGNQIGVAPEAKWMGCRNMDAGDGRPNTYISCMQFMTAPTDVNGNNPNPALRAHIINNSWGCPPSETCAADTLRTAVEAAQAAGIFFEASVDSFGPACGTVQNPPTIYAASFSTTAIDINNNLAAFSSRGPVIVDGSNRLKPEISAPGVNVRSSVNSSDTAYSSYSGTAMAGPHVVGVVALLWSAHPELARNITATKMLLEMTANPQVNASGSPPYCGNTPPTQIPNNYFGYGLVDALAAVNGAGGATPTRTNTPTPVQSTSTRTSTPGRTVTPCGECNLDILVVTSSCNIDGTVHWITVVHNPEPCALPAPWRAELQVRENGGNFRAVRIQYATTDFPPGDTILDGVFCYRFSQNLRDVRVEYLFEDQEHRSMGSNSRMQERGIEPNSDSAIPASGSVRTNPSVCDANMASPAMAPCERIDSCE